MTAGSAGRSSCSSAWPCAGRSSGLPLEGQKELLGRFRMASADERRRVREALAAHLRERHPEIDL